nr:3-hydroxyisobutyryl-CoA hydrolase [Klebsiella pneumoniae]
MNAYPVLFSRTAASCRLTLNREDKCHAINEEMIELLDRYLSEIENDAALRLVELTATGDKFFCAGGDIKSGPLTRRWIWAESGLNAVTKFFPPAQSATADRRQY